MATCAIVASKVKITGFVKDQTKTNTKLKNLKKGAASRILCFEIDALEENDFVNTTVRL